MNIIFSTIGLIGGLLCAIADLLLDLKGPNNKKLGTRGFIDSMWLDMPRWRFIASSILSMFAVPMYTLGVISLANIINVDNEALGLALKMAICIGAMGGFFIHNYLCLVPIIYKDIMEKKDFELAEKVVNDTFNSIKVPFVVLYLILMVVPAVIVDFSIITGVLNAPMWCVLLNPVIAQIVGWIFRATKLKCFIDAPGICAASLGLALYGVIGLIVLV